MHWRLPVVCLVLQVPAADNYFTALNSAVFSDGSFVFVPKGVKSPMELSTYFRINASETGQVGASFKYINLPLSWEMPAP
jgi:Fe-S cluster assembly scaffold protein SufB